MDDNRTLFVGNLGPEVTEALLRELFLQAGPIEKVRLVVINGTPKPFAHIVYVHESSVRYATEIFRGTQLHRRELLIQQNNAGRDSGQNQYAPRVNNAREERNDHPPRGNYYRDERSENSSRGSYYRTETPPRSNYHREGRNDYPPHGYQYREERNERSRSHYREDRSDRSRGHQYRDERSERPSHGYHQTKYTYR